MHKEFLFKEELSPTLTFINAGFGILHVAQKNGNIPKLERSFLKGVFANPL